MKLSTLFLSCLSVFFFEPMVQAQNQESPWSFGVKAGINSSNYHITNSSSYNDGTVGVNAGLTVEYALKKKFFLSSGLEFTTKGVDISHSYYGFGSDNGLIESSYYQDDRRFKYLQLPLTIGYRLPVSNNVSLTARVGGYFALGLSGKATFRSFAYTYGTSAPEGSFPDITSSDYFQKEYKQNGDTDFGLLGGIGVEYKRFSLNANYEFGLRNLYTASPSESQTSALKNRNLTFSVGYRFK